MSSDRLPPSRDGALASGYNHERPPEQAPAGYDPLAESRLTRAVGYVNGTFGTVAETVILVVGALGLMAGFIAGAEAAFGKTGLWLILEVLTIAACAWARGNLLKARAGNASPPVVARYQRSVNGLGLFVALIAIRLVFHAY